MNGIEYGGVLGLTNAPDINNFFQGTQTSPYMNAANIYMSSAFGKVVLGDSHGATDLVVGSPSVGEGQTTGRYVDFLNTAQFAKTFVYGVDNSDHSTNVTYFTPKVGYAGVKAQMAASYVPQFYNYGSGTVTYNSGSVATVGTNTYSPYHDVFKVAGDISGNFQAVALTGSAHVISGSSDKTSFGVGTSPAWIANAPTGVVQSFTAWGVGAQAAVMGFTVGGSYTDNGSYDAVAGQTKDQNQYSGGIKYEFSKIGLAANYTGGKGYDNMLATAGGVGSSANYVKTFDSYGIGGTYSWAPGLTSNVDGVYFDQKSDASVENEGYVLLVSQKLAF